MLVDGTVKIYGTITVNEKDIELTADADGVEVTVANTELTSITKLTTGGTVDYDGSKYEMTSDGRLKVTEANGEIKFYAGGEEVNILDPGAATAYEEVTEDGSILKFWRNLLKAARLNLARPTAIPAKSLRWQR